MEFSRSEYSSREPFPSPGDLPNPRIEPRPPILQADSLPAEPWRKLKNTRVCSLSLLQGIFPTQESNRGVLHWRQILFQLSFQETSNNAYLTLNPLNPLVIRSFLCSPQAKPESRYSHGPSCFSCTSCLHFQVRTHFTAASGISLNLLCILPVCFEWLLFLGTQLVFLFSSIWTHCHIFCSPQQFWWVHYSNQLFILSAFNSGPHIFALTASCCVTMDELLNLPKTEIPHLWSGDSLMHRVRAIKQS